MRADHLVQGAVHAESGRPDALVPNAWNDASADAAGAFPAAQPCTVAAAEPPALADTQPTAVDPSAHIPASNPTAHVPAIQPTAQVAASKPSAPALNTSAHAPARPPAVGRRWRMHCLGVDGQPVDGWHRLRQHHQLGMPLPHLLPVVIQQTMVLVMQRQAMLYMLEVLISHPELPLCRSPALLQAACNAAS